MEDTFASDRKQFNTNIKQYNQWVVQPTGDIKCPFDLTSDLLNLSGSLIIPMLCF